MTRRALVSSLLSVALAVSGVGWAETRSETRTVDSSSTLTRPPGLAIDVALQGRSDALLGVADQRPPKARVRLGLAVLVGLTVLQAAAMATLSKPSPAPRYRRWRSRSVALRAPPRLRLA